MKVEAMCHPLYSTEQVSMPHVSKQHKTEPIILLFAFILAENKNLKNESANNKLQINIYPNTTRHLLTSTYLSQFHKLTVKHQSRRFICFRRIFVLFLEEPILEK